MSGFGYRGCGQRIGFQVSGFGYQISDIGCRGSGTVGAGSTRAHQAIHENVLPAASRVACWGSRVYLSKWKVDIRLPGKVNSNFNGARPVY